MYICKFFAHNIFAVILCIVGLMTVATWQSSIIVDRDPPAEGIVLDGDQTVVDVDYQFNMTRLCVTFSGFHGAVSYSWAIGTTPGGSDVAAFRHLTALESKDKKACNNGLNLMDNTVYYSTVTALNVVDLSRTVSSDGGKNTNLLLLNFIILIHSAH